MTARLVVQIIVNAHFEKDPPVAIAHNDVARLSLIALNDSTKTSQLGPLYCLSMNFETPQLESMTDQPSNGDQGIPKPSLLAELFLKAYHEFCQIDETALLKVEPFSANTSVFSHSDTGVRPWLKRARDILDAQFAEQPSLSDIAARVGVHPVHLAREFRKHYGSSIGEYVRKIRVEFACLQLLASDDPPVKIAAAAGFADQSHFSVLLNSFWVRRPDNTELLSRTTMPFARVGREHRNRAVMFPLTSAKRRKISKTPPDSIEKIRTRASLRTFTILTATKLLFGGNNMGLINGIGGVFLFTNNPKRLVEWYRDCLGIVPAGEDSECNSIYTTFEYRDVENPEIKRTLAWAIMPTDQDITDKPRTGRINYCVKNMADTLSHLQSKGVAIDKTEEYEGFGKFAWLTDPDGNKIELWEEPRESS